MNGVAGFTKIKRSYKLGTKSAKKPDPFLPSQINFLWILGRKNPQLQKQVSHNTPWFIFLEIIFLTCIAQLATIGG